MLRGGKKTNKKTNKQTKLELVSSINVMPYKASIREQRIKLKEDKKYCRKNGTYESIYTVARQWDILWP